jgi:hypothetical protein
MNPKLIIIYLLYFLIFINQTNQFSFIKGKSGQTFIDQSIFYKKDSDVFFIVSKYYTDSTHFSKYLTKSDESINLNLTESLTTDKYLFGVNTYHSYIYRTLINSASDVSISYDSLSSSKSSSSFNVIKTISDLSCNTSKKCYSKIFVDNTNIYFTFISGSSSGKFYVYYSKTSSTPSISQMSISKDYSFSSSEYTEQYSCEAYTNPLNSNRWGLICLFNTKNEVVFFTHSTSPVSGSLTCPIGKLKYFYNNGNGYIIVGCVSSTTLTVYYATYTESSSSNPDIASLTWNKVTSISGCSNKSSNDLDITLDTSNNILFVACSNANTITSINEVYSDAIIINRITEFGSNNKIFQEFLLKSVVENFPVLSNNRNNFVTKINDLTLYNTGDTINLHYDFNLYEYNETYYYYSFVYKIYYKQCNDLIVTARVDEFIEIDFSKSLNLNTKLMGKFNIAFLYFEDVYNTFLGTLYYDDKKTIIPLDNATVLAESQKYYYRINSSEIGNKKLSDLKIRLNYLGYMTKDTPTKEPYPLECEFVFTICIKYEVLNNGECVNCAKTKTYFFDGKCLSNRTGYAVINDTYNALEKCGDTCKTCIIPPVGIVQNCDTCYKGQTLDETYLYCSGSIIKEDSGNNESNSEEDSSDIQATLDAALLAKVASLVCNNGLFIKLQNIIIVLLTIFVI